MEPDWLEQEVALQGTWLEQDWLEQEVALQRAWSGWVTLLRISLGRRLELLRCVAGRQPGVVGPGFSMRKIGA